MEIIHLHHNLFRFSAKQLKLQNPPTDNICVIKISMSRSYIGYVLYYMLYRTYLIKFIYTLGSTTMENAKITVGGKIAMAAAVTEVTLVNQSVVTWRSITVTTNVTVKLNYTNRIIAQDTSATGEHILMND